MNKLLSLLTFMAFAANANAAMMKTIKNATNPKLNALYIALAPDWNKGGNCLEVSLVKVLKPTESRGRTEEELLTAMTKESIHKYVTRWFDEGIQLTPISSVKEITDVMNASNTFSDEETVGIESMKKGLNSLLKNKKMLILAGDASGNNTAGEVFAVYDTENNEILSLVASNFASDSSCGD